MEEGRTTKESPQKEISMSETQKPFFVFSDFFPSSMTDSPYLGKDTQHWICTYLRSEVKSIRNVHVAFYNDSRENFL